MTKYLIEIGTEELPYKFIPSAMEQLKESLAKAFEGNRISYKDIKTYGTPRRLAVIVEDITESQPNVEKVIKGPPTKAAFNGNGKITQAGIGFAKKQNVNPEDLYKESVGNVEYVFAKVKEEGRKTGEVLKDIIPDIILRLQGSHFMRWGDLEVRFSRPIRWLVSLMDNEEVKIKIADIESTRCSQGHRFYNNKEVEITSPDSYMEDLYKTQVIIDTVKRREEIIKQASNIAKSVNGNVHLNPELVDEVTYIVEWPHPILGSFDKKYLVIPKDVIVTVMAAHQRYFPVFAENGQLLNYFITMANNDASKALENIKRGNERVLKARLDDAIFFYTEDTRRTLESRIEDLKGVTFQKGLGTIHDKVSRIREISYFTSEELNLDKATIDNVEKTALLSKADLVTSLVREFTELQGFIGMNYAKLDGEDCLVSVGIAEHYMPVSADGELADSITGQVVGISDKIDTIAGVFALGKIPTGSADPLGLRRAALGIIITIIKKDINLNLSNVIENAVSIQPVKIENTGILVSEIRDFIIQRLRIYLTENYRYDVVEAALSTKDPLANLKDLVKRTEVLSKLIEKEKYNLFHDAANRIHRIIKSEQFNPTPDPSLFVQDIEGQLWNCTKGIDEDNLDYNELVSKLESCVLVIEKFFDEVLVMDPNMDIRQNRLSLLGNIREKFLKLADFSKIVA
ncbi:MAG: glycine--tRNA ligase subunit beta [Candidatus Melainabacteria bacterium GWF2_32_7]|nr:MAG: glycine--tRNA ligase subunit beta [Candidatus Melainabacteria bacterium GWF2_32_7]